MKPITSIPLVFRILFIFIACVPLVSCGGDDEPDYNDIVGSWYGTRSYYNSVGGTKYQYLTVRFNADKTGSLEYEGPTSVSIGYFSYSISGKTITCKGVWASSLGDADSNFTFTLDIQGDRLKPTSLYTYFILTRDGSVVTDGDGNEVTGDSGNSGSSSGSGASGGNDSGNGGSGSGGSTTVPDLKDYITSGLGWSTSDSKYFFSFSTSGSVRYMETSSTKVGSLGYVTLMASGSYSASGNKIVCYFSDIYWDGASAAPNLFPGWTNGSNAFKTYTAEISAPNVLYITTPDGKTLRMTKF